MSFVKSIGDDDVVGAELLYPNELLEFMVAIGDGRFRMCF
jgi:hypothetical protein